MNKTILAFSLALGILLLQVISIENALALKDKDKRYAIITLQNLKSKDVDVTVYVYDEKKDKKFEGAPEAVDTATSTVHTFKWDNDDLPDPGIVPGTEIITCIEFKDGDGEPSCLTDRFKSESQPFRLTMDVDYIRDN